MPAPSPTPSWHAAAAAATNLIAPEVQTGQTLACPSRLSGPLHPIPNTLGTMRSSGSDQRPRGRYNGNRPFKQQKRTPNQNFDSNGPNGKVRGNAHQIFERYVGFAREAAIGGDPIAA